VGRALAPGDPAWRQVGDLAQRRVERERPRHADQARLAFDGVTPIEELPAIVVLIVGTVEDGVTVEDGPDEGTRAVRPLAGAYQQFYAAVRDALLGGGSMPVDPADAVEVLRVIEAAETSAREGRVVTLAPPAAG
jgi:predicted dehydrogenase